MDDTAGALTQPPLPDQRRLAALDRQLARLMATPPGGRALAAALLLSAPIVWLMATAPNAAFTYTCHDVFIPLDAAWRVLQGQWPHLDFYLCPRTSPSPRRTASGW